MIELELASIDQIFEELKKRYKAVLLYTLFDPDNRSEGDQIFYAGGMYNCVGMAKVAEQRLTERLMVDDRSPSSPDEFPGG